jgi:hypothetical protein
MKDLKPELKARLERLRNADLELKYKGLLAMITGYLENPSEEERNKVKTYIVSILKPEEFIDFFLDNLASMETLDQAIEKAKNNNL